MILLFWNNCPKPTRILLNSPIKSRTRLNRYELLDNGSKENPMKTGGVAGWSSLLVVQLLQTNKPTKTKN